MSRQHHDPRATRDGQPTPLSPDQEAALNAAMDADGPPARTPAYLDWLRRTELLAPRMEAALARLHARLRRRLSPP